MTADLGEQVRSLAWYHTIDLPNGVTTPGFFDLREVLAKLPLPDSLVGKRCLDIGSCDGFYAFEMERRGAAEVVGIDVDDPSDRDWPGEAPPAGTTADYNRALRAFGIARDALGSGVQRRNLSVYDLTPDVIGQFDFAVMGSLLLHLQDAVRALRAVHTVVTGELLSVDQIDLALSLTHPRTPVGRLWSNDTARWWTPNAAAHRRWLRAAGWEIERAHAPLFVPLGAGHPSRAWRVPRSRQQVGFAAVVKPFGVAHQWVLARPS